MEKICWVSPEVWCLCDSSAGEDWRKHLGAHDLRLLDHRLHDPILVRGLDNEVCGKGSRRPGMGLALDGKPWEDMRQHKGHQRSHE